MKKTIIISFFFLFVYNNMIYAHDDNVIHRQITEKSAKNSDINLDYYLKNNLNFIKGLETKLPSEVSQTIMKWLTEVCQ